MIAGLAAGFIFLVFVFTVGLYCLYLKTAQDALRAVLPPARRLRPGQVWMMLIPIFSFGYSFIFTKRLASSISADMQAHAGRAGPQKFIYDVGLAMSIAQLSFLFPWEHAVVFFAQLAWLVLWVIHWMLVASAGRKLRALPVLSAREGQVFAEY